MGRSDLQQLPCHGTGGLYQVHIFPWVLDGSGCSGNQRACQVHHTTLLACLTVRFESEQLRGTFSPPGGPFQAAPGIGPLPPEPRELIKKIRSAFAKDSHGGHNERPYMQISLARCLMHAICMANALPVPVYYSADSTAAIVFLEELIPQRCRRQSSGFCM